MLPYIFVFVASLYHPRDPDLGWHLRYGEYFFQTGHILRANTLSALMQDFLWVNSSWMTDLISFGAYQWAGFLGLATLSALVVTMTAFFFARWAKLTWWDEVLLFPPLVFFIEPVISVSFRGQLISLLFLGILFFLLRLYKEGKQVALFFTIPLFALWGNLHGQFFMGLVLFATWIGTHIVLDLWYVRSRQNVAKYTFLIAVLVACFIASLINPFGIGIYKEALIHIRNPDLKFVAEYLPIDERSNIWQNHVLLTGILILGTVYLAFSQSWKRSIPEMVILTLLYGLSFLVRRYAWPFYLFSLYLLAPIASQLSPPLPRVRHIAGSIIGFTILGFILLLKTPFSQFSSMSWDSYCVLANCSAPAARALLSAYKGERLLTTYDFGGWLIWNYRDIKPTIDGRMHLWRDKNGYSGFDYYYPFEQNIKDIDGTQYEMAFVSVKKPIYNRLEQLVNDGLWVRLYKDEIAALFRKKSLRTP